MGSHPLNLGFRFLLEIGALGAFGYWGFTLGSRPWRWLFSMGMTLAPALTWGVFAVPDDPSRSGKAPVPVPGLLRLALELLIFAGAALLLHLSGHSNLGIAFGILVLIHYALSHDRVLWLLRR